VRRAQEELHRLVGSEAAREREALVQGRVTASPTSCSPPGASPPGASAASPRSSPGSGACSHGSRAGHRVGQVDARSRKTIQQNHQEHAGSTGWPPNDAFWCILLQAGKRTDTGSFRFSSVLQRPLLAPSRSRATVEPAALGSSVRSPIRAGLTRRRVIPYQWSRCTTSSNGRRLRRASGRSGPSAG
jgi:hypothetical protein